MYIYCIFYCLELKPSKHRATQQLQRSTELKAESIATFINLFFW